MQLVGEPALDRSDVPLLAALRPQISAGSAAAVRALRESSGRREDTPVRKSFVRSETADVAPPLARLVSTAGRGGAVPVKLYLALLWRCSAPPFATDISARQWSKLLDLRDPNGNGARRVTAAMTRLADVKLVSVRQRPGESSEVTLLQESGDGSEYSLPSTAYVMSPGPNSPHIYFKLPVALWTSGHIQTLSATALAMLLVILAESHQPGRPVWWATDVFPARYGISAAMRARGTRELVERDLLDVKKQLVSDVPGREFGRERVRNLYQLVNEATPSTPDTNPAPAGKPARSRRSTPGTPRRRASNSGRPTHS